MLWLVRSANKWYQEEIALLMKDVAFARGNSVSFKIDPALGADVPEA
jgi:hypothetical protein